MKRFALIGEPLGHSQSPFLHKAIYRQLEIDDASYRTVELAEERLKSFFTGFKVGGFDGVNVTIPHKTSVIDLLDEVDPKAKLIKAVNCVHRDGNRLIGYNTDITGFEYSLKQNDVPIEGKGFAILGAGGSAKAVAAVLAEGGAKIIYIVNRTIEHAAQLIQIVNAVNGDVKTEVVVEADLAKHTKKISCVVNTTSLGMAPGVEASALSDATAEKLFDDKTVAFDLIYNPCETQFMQAAAKQGATTLNGIQMLVAQAVYSVETWMGGNIVAHVDMNALARDLEKNIK